MRGRGGDAGGALRRARRRVLARFVLAGLALVLGLLGAEVLARIFSDPVQYYRGMVEDRYLGFRKPGFVALTNSDEFGAFPYQLNAQGHRGPELPELPRGPRRPSDPERILFVGDSFLAAWDVRPERRLPEVIARRISEQGGAVEWHVLASDDYGTAQELLLLERYGPQFAPDTVVLLVYPGNDVVNSSLALAGRTTVSPGDLLRPYLVRDGRGELVRRHHRAWMVPLRRHSQAVRLLERSYLNRQRRLLRPPFAESEVPWARLARGVAPREDLELYREHGQDRPWGRAWVDFEHLLGVFGDRVVALGARPVFVVVPAREQVLACAQMAELDLGARLVEKSGLAQVLDWNSPERRLAAFFRERGFSAVLGLDLLRAAAERGGEPLYVADGHLHGRGHELLAEALLPLLLHPGERVLPSPPASRVPVDALGDARDWPAVLDFRADPHRRALAEGWLHHGNGEGWRVGPYARLVVPARGGELVLSGVVPEDLPLPATLTLTVSWLGEEDWTIRKPGPFSFTLSVPVPPGALVLWPSLFATVRLHVDRQFLVGTDSRPHSLTITSVGWR